MNKIFISKSSHEDAAFKAKMAGYFVAGYGSNKRGEFVAFGRK